MTARLNRKVRLRGSRTCTPALILLILLLSPASALAWELRVCAGANHLPYSNDAGEGFENRLAELLADELEAELAWMWLSQPSPRLFGGLVRQGACDLVMGIIDGQQGFLSTLAYYRSVYVFVYRDDAGFTLASLDDDALARLTIGVAFDGRNTSPPTQALLNRGLASNQEFLMPSMSDEHPQAIAVEAVLQGDVDVAIVWGPPAGYFVRQRNLPLTVKPVQPEIDLPFLPMTFPVTLGVRPGDIALRDALNRALAARWEAVDALLEDFAVPRLELPAPHPNGVSQ